MEGTINSRLGGADYEEAQDSLVTDLNVLFPEPLTRTPDMEQPPLYP